MMRFYRDLTIEYMGQELGLGLSGAKMRLYRSIDRLRATYFELDAVDSRRLRSPADATGRVA